MNTRLGKSFGLAFVVAVGILAVMFALGTFNAPKAGADVSIGGSVTTTPDEPGPGAAIGMELTFRLDASATAFDEITISLEDFGLPASIAERSVSVRVGASGDAAGAVDVDGDNIVVELPDLNGDDAELGIDAGSDITIVIRKNAGITAPTAAGEYMVKVAYNDQTPAVELGTVNISRTVTVDPEKGGSGTEITVTGKAFADGTGTLSSAPTLTDTPTSLKDVTVKDGEFETTVAAKDLKKATANGESLIIFRDSDGKKADATFTVTGTTTLGSDSVGKGKLLEISIADWIQAEPAMVRIDGVPLVTKNEHGNDADVTLDDDKAATFYVYVTSEVGLGTKTVVLFDGVGPGAARLDSASVEVTALALNVSPSTAVAGQEITVEGTGFSSDVQLDTLSVGGIGQPELSNRNDVSEYDVLSGGRIVITFDVPDGVTDGSKTIRVTDEDGRVGEVALMVRKPTITLNPITSRRATTVSVSGTGFPANKNITVDFGTETGIATGRTDNTGNFSASFVVPSDANIGGEVEVKASFGDDYSAEATHTVPDKGITVTPEVARSGDAVDIVGTGFPRYADVEAKIGDGPFRATTARTDNVGDFNVSVIIPGIDSGTHVIQVKAGGSIATWVITVPDAAVIRTRPSGDVFADLIASNNLTVVWHFDNGTKAWSFYDPRPEVAAAVDLNEVTSGDNVWIQVVADQMFQGEMLTAGWNLVTLD